jgi:hypothetical protein
VSGDAPEFWGAFRKFLRPAPTGTRTRVPMCGNLPPVASHMLKEFELHHELMQQDEGQIVFAVEIATLLAAIGLGALILFGKFGPLVHY